MWRPVAQKRPAYFPAIFTFISRSFSEFSQDRDARWGTLPS
jgi:hypothetical protein